MKTKETNHRYQWLTHHVGLFQDGMELLTAREAAILDYLYWQQFTVDEVVYEMGLTSKTVMRDKRRIFFKIAPFFIPHVTESLTREDRRTIASEV